MKAIYYRKPPNNDRKFKFHYKATSLQLLFPGLSGLKFHPMIQTFILNSSKTACE